MTPFSADTLRAPRPTSKRRIPAIDHKTIRRMIRRRLAHDVDRDATEIRRLAEPADRNPRHHVGDEFIVAHYACAHVPLAPDGLDSIPRDTLDRQLDRERPAQRAQ